MPKSVDEVKFINDCGLLKPALTGSGVGCRKRAMVGSRAGGAGVGGDEFSLGGVGVVKLRSKGLRGTGRIRGGPSSAILKPRFCITDCWGPVSATLSTTFTARANEHRA